MTLVARPTKGQRIGEEPFLAVVRTHGKTSEFRAWINHKEVTRYFKTPRPAPRDGYYVHRARIPSDAPGIRPNRGNVLKVRAVSEDFRHRTVFRVFRSS